MGLFDLKTSTARWVHGRLIYTPLPPDSRWKQVAGASVPVIFAAVYVSQHASEAGYVVAVLAFCALLAGFAWHRRRREPVRPTEPLEVDDALVVRIRRLLESGRVGDAMLAVEAELTVVLGDAKVIVDAVQRRIDHERGQASGAR